MKKLFVLILLLNLHQMNAQDSLSAAFTKILNEYRIQNNLHPLVYDSSLDSVSMVRLIESAHGIDDCFEDINTAPNCKDGVRDLHFKFNKTATSFNQNNNKIQILAENMLVIAEFTTFKIVSDTKNFLDKVDVNSLPTSHTECTPVINVAKECLDLWISSHGHNQNLLHNTATRFSFKIYRMKHYNLDWLHAVYLTAKEKE